MPYADKVCEAIYGQLDSESDVPLTPWGESAAFAGYALSDGESVPISGTLRLVSVERVRT